MNKNKILLICLFFFIGYILYKNIAGSIFLQKKNRINVVFYGSTSTFYSLGFDRDINYFFTLPSNVEVGIPGGYGYYRIGALGKLVSLEQDRDILKKSFSAISSSFVDLYFYPQGQTIYYNKEAIQNNLPSFRTIFMYKSNSNILDRVLLWMMFLQNTPNQYKEIVDLPQNTDHGRALFDREAFFKEIQGYFYKKTYRNINDRVQILYTKNYKTAQLMSDILEGEGIQVVDLSQTDTSVKGCKIIYNGQKLNDPIPKDMQNFFGCSIEIGETSVSDIIFILGNLEKDWSAE